MASHESLSNATLTNHHPHVVRPSCAHRTIQAAQSVSLRPRRFPASATELDYTDSHPAISSRCANPFVKTSQFTSPAPTPMNAADLSSNLSEKSTLLSTVPSNCCNKSERLTPCLPKDISFRVNTRSTNPGKCTFLKSSQPSSASYAREINYKRSFCTYRRHIKGLSSNNLKNPSQTEASRPNLSSTLHLATASTPAAPSSSVFTPASRAPT
jgi:hypothetical protein